MKPIFVFKCGCELDHYKHYTVTSRRGCPKHGDSIEKVWLNCVYCGTTYIKTSMAYRANATPRCEPCKKLYCLYTSYCYHLRNRPKPTFEDYRDKIYQGKRHKPEERIRAERPDGNRLSRAKIAAAIMAGIPWEMPETPGIDSACR